jgi:hypothetical protein
MQINLGFDAQAQAAPQSFRDEIQKAANLLDSTFKDNISVNISVGYGEINGSAEPSGGASAGPASGVFDSYAKVRSWLATNASYEVQSGVAALPTGSSIQGQSIVAVWRAQEKLLGDVAANDTGLDGSSGFATDIPTAVLEGVAIHELTHAMGRVPYGSQPDIFDLFRFSSPGNRYFSGSSPANASYFSLDGGATDLADYGQNSDPSDFLNSSGRTPNDPFNEFYNGNTVQSLTRIDILQMEALGFHAQTTGLAKALSDFNGDHTSDVLLRDVSSGGVSAWTLNNGNFAGSTQIGGMGSNLQIQGIGDFNGDGTSDVLYRDNTNGGISVWTVKNDVVTAAAQVGGMGSNLQIQGVGDFNGDGTSDVLYRDNTNGGVSVWTVKNDVVTTSKQIGGMGGNLQIMGVGDFNGDGSSDVLYRDMTTGGISVWTIQNNLVAAATQIGGMGGNLQIAGVGDFNGDGTSDVLYRDSTTGGVSIWTVQNDAVTAATQIGSIGDNISIAGVGDYNGDGTSDILLRNNSSGGVTDWTVSNNHLVSAVQIGGVGTNIRIS